MIRLDTFVAIVNKEWAFDGMYILIRLLVFVCEKLFEPASLLC